MRNEKTERRKLLPIIKITVVVIIAVIITVTLIIVITSDYAYMKPAGY